MKLILKLTSIILKVFCVKQRICIFVGVNHNISIFVGVNHVRCKSYASENDLENHCFALQLKKNCIK